MVGKAQVFLRDLELEGERGLLHLPEQRAEGLPGLEIHRPVLYLDDHVVREGSVQGEEFLHGLVRPVGALGVIYEGAPHDDAAVGLQGLGEHVGSVGMGAAIVQRAGLSFGIGLHQEAAEVGDGRIDLIGLGFPPRPDGGIQGVAAPQAVQPDGGGPLDGQVRADAVLPENVRDGRHPGDMGCIQDQWIGIHVVKDGPVQADGGAELPVMPDALLRNLRRSPLPHGFPGIPAFYAVVQVVPVVEDADVVEGFLPKVHARTVLPRHLRPLQGVQAVPEPGLGAAIDMADSVGVVDMESLGGKGRVDAGFHGGPDFSDRPAGGEPESAPVLFHRLHRSRTGGEKEDSREKCQWMDAAHIVLI